MFEVWKRTALFHSPNVETVPMKRPHNRTISFRLKTQRVKTTSEWPIFVDATPATVSTQLATRRVPNRQIWLSFTGRGKRMDECRSVVDLHQRDAAFIQPLRLLLEKPDVAHAVGVLTFTAILLDVSVEFIKRVVELRQSCDTLLSRSKRALRRNVSDKDHMPAYTYAVATPASVSRISESVTLQPLFQQKRSDVADGEIRTALENLTADIKIPISRHIERFAVHPTAIVCFGKFLSENVRSHLSNHFR